MATGRTVNKWRRVYIDGYDMSGDGRSIGPLTVEYGEADLTAHMSDTVKGYLRTHPHYNLGVFNAVFDNNTSPLGVNAIALTQASRTVLVAQGIRAAPAQGDPVYAGYFKNTGGQVLDDAGAVVINMPFAGVAQEYASTYGNLNIYPWGALLHASGAETAVNSAVGVDDRGASTANGGWFMFHGLAGNGTATIKAQHASTNSDGSFADITGATSGVLDFSNPRAASAFTTAVLTINRYLRWQIVLGTATTVTFVCAFMRN